jgi:nucleoside-diphosphate-sugar epimerase
MKVIINGASGWLGRATLGALKEIDSNLGVQELQLITSNARSIETDDYGKLETISLDSTSTRLTKSDVFVQLAFKTRDFISKMGNLKYEETNQEIVKKSIDAIKFSKPKHVVMVSSGVVSQWLSSSGNSNPDSYVKMKLIEESEIGSYCRSNGINLINLRLWGASGAHMTEPLKYAIGDLIYQNSVSDVISIKSGNEVFRRYADASEQMQICLMAALSGMTATIESGGTIIEIEELARMIIEFSGSDKLIDRPVLTNLLPDKYYSESQRMEEIAELFGIQLSDMWKQIELTTMAVSKSTVK